MALEGTHIRFALTLKDQYEVKDLNKFLAGTIYPDSRYVTKIKRTLTHDKKFLKKEFYRNNDFKKGWMLHLVYDQTQSCALLKFFPCLFKKPEQKISFDNERWITETALKILQDISDIKEFDINNYINYLDLRCSPNNENIALIIQYNKIMIDLYSKAPNLDLNDYIKMWEKLGIDKNVSKILKTKIQIFQNNPEILSQVNQLYEETLSTYSNYLV